MNARGRAIAIRPAKRWSHHRRVRPKTSRSIILCDLDYFKQYNDSYGSPATKA
ncbi:diguanylate cyclase domain-containing protein [Lyngbya sp. CCY1209]|uniref:diguanylate cyclase domain-containing protein n=1 Tax=Lyngbya sp. CCY1209 TaxID=2886103 RepID=UPI002D1FF820|nr:diguanylate cyclase [Lyngbya sp. CCY1209]MEB3885825.1 GGDEF domain-containing protein [Lyngbya sp. CCY1209]